MFLLRTKETIGTAGSECHSLHLNGDHRLDGGVNWQILVRFDAHDEAVANRSLVAVMPRVTTGKDSARPPPFDWKNSYPVHLCQIGAATLPDILNQRAIFATQA